MERRQTISFRRFDQSRRVFAVLCPIDRRIPLLRLRITEEALRMGSVVFLAPVTLLLEFGRDLGIALTALFLWDAMFDTPPATMIMATMIMATMIMAVAVRVRMGMAIPVLRTGVRCRSDRIGPSATGDCQSDGKPHHDSQISDESSFKRERCIRGVLTRMAQICVGAAG